MADLSVSELERELAALKQSWATLAPNIEQAREIRAQAAKNPELLKEDPRSDALVRWLDTFERDVVALETLYDAATDPSFRLPLEDVRLARQGTDKLLEALEKERTLSGAGARAMA
jgi:hypothetical protein